MEHLESVKAQVSRWLAAFSSKHGRPASREDLRQNPHIEAAMRALKAAQRSVANSPQQSGFLGPRVSRSVPATKPDKREVPSASRGFKRNRAPVAASRPKRRRGAVPGTSLDPQGSCQGDQSMAVGGTEGTLQTPRSASPSHSPRAHTTVSPGRAPAAPDAGGGTRAAPNAGSTERGADPSAGGAAGGSRGKFAAPHGRQAEPRSVPSHPARKQTTQAEAEASFCGAAHVEGDVFSGHGFGLTPAAAAKAGSKGNYVKLNLRRKRFIARKPSKRGRAARGAGYWNTPAPLDASAPAAAPAFTEAALVRDGQATPTGDSPQSGQHDSGAGSTPDAPPLTSEAFGAGPSFTSRRRWGAAAVQPVDPIDVCLDVAGEGGTAPRLLPGDTAGQVVAASDVQPGTLVVGDADDAAALAAVQADLRLTAGGQVKAGRAVRAAAPAASAAAYARKPVCPGHGMPAKLLRVKKAGRNKGRAFYVCPLPRSEQCSFFAWKDQHVAHAVAAYLGAAQAAVDEGLEGDGVAAQGSGTLAEQQRWQRLERERGVAWARETLPVLRAAVKKGGVLADAELVQRVLGKVLPLSRLVKMQLVALLAAHDVQAARAKAPARSEPAQRQESVSTGQAQCMVDLSEDSSVSSASQEGEDSDEAEGGATWRAQDSVALNTTLQGAVKPSAGQAHTARQEAPLHTTLLEHFGFSEFRGGQEWVIRRVLAGLSTMYVAPTGSGKSLTYQLPSLLLPGITIVVSPLVALMRDQMLQLPPALRGSAIVGRQTAADLGAALRSLKAGVTDVLFVSPERLLSPAFARLARQSDGMPLVSLVVVDEAHCMSEWSHNFRPAYLQLGGLIPQLFGAKTPVLALTATATPAVVQDVTRMLHVQDEGVHSSSWLRSNLILRVAKVPTDEGKQRILRRLLEDKALSRKPVLVYVLHQATAEAVASYLKESGFSAAAYHAGLPDSRRERAQSRFMAGAVDVVVATVAFGMGINKSNIRCVVHYDPPKSLEEYVQQVGRAGRDGQAALALLLLAPGDMARVSSIVRGSDVSPLACAVALTGVWAPLLWSHRPGGAASPGSASPPPTAYCSVSEEWMGSTCGLPRAMSETLLSLAVQRTHGAVRFWRATTWCSITFTRQGHLRDASKAGGRTVQAAMVLAATAQASGVATMIADAATLGPQMLERADMQAAWTLLQEDGAWMWRSPQGAAAIKVHLASLANVLGVAVREVLGSLRQADACREAAVAWLGSGWMLEVPSTGTMAEDFVTLCSGIVEEAREVQARAGAKLASASAVFAAAAASDPGVEPSEPAAHEQGVPTELDGLPIAAIPPMTREQLETFTASISAYFDGGGDGAERKPALEPPATLSAEEVRGIALRCADEVARRTLQAYSPLTAALSDCAVPLSLAALSVPGVLRWVGRLAAEDPCASAATETYWAARAAVLQDQTHEGRHVWAHPHSKFILAACANACSVARVLVGVSSGSPHALHGKGCSHWRAAASVGMEGVLAALRGPPEQ